MRALAFYSIESKTHLKLTSLNRRLPGSKTISTALLHMVLKYWHRFARLKTRWKVLLSMQAMFTVQLIRIRFQAVADKKRDDVILLARYRGERNPESVCFSRPMSLVASENLIVVDNKVVPGNPKKRAIW